MVKAFRDDLCIRLPLVELNLDVVTRVIPAIQRFAH
jgi:hypothetical protein